MATTATNLSAQLSKDIKGPSLTIWLCAGSVWAFIIWANFAWLDEIVRGDGEIISSSRPQIIQNLEGGILSELMVKEGDEVLRGDVLARLYGTQFRSSVDDLKDQITALEIRRLRLEAELQGASVVEVPRDLAQRSPQMVASEQALLAALIATRRYFVARQDPGGLGRSVRSLLQFGLSGFLIVWVLLALNPRRLVGDPSIAAQAAHAALSLIGVTGPVEFEQRAVWLDDLTSAIGLTFGVVALVVAGYHLLRSPEPRPSLDPDDEQRLRALLDQRDGDSLGYFALRRDKAAVFAHGGKSAVSYRVLAGVALASGDPVGDVGAWPGAIEAFLGICTRYGWSPAVLGCSERGATAWSKAGLDALELGDEAVLETASFSLDGRPMRGVRQTVNRMQRSGHTVEVTRLRDLDETARMRVAERAHRWRGAEDERGFSMASSRVADPSDPDAVIVPALRDGEPSGMLQLVPWGRDGLSLDLMVRDADADNGVNELMIAELMAAAKDHGVKRVSLNFAMFRSALERGERIGAGPVARGWARVLRIASRWWQIDSLYRFNAKFRPSWYPRYVLFPAVRDLPRVLFVVLEAEGFGGRPPALLRLLRR